jgi:hypothetical protein
MRGGLIPVAAAAIGVGGVLVWTMAAHDPYWRLFETASVPAPSYETPEELQAALASMMVDQPNADSGTAPPDAPAARQDISTVLAMAALEPRPAEPVIAVPMALLPDGLPASVDDAAPVLALAPAPLTMSLPADIPAGAAYGPAPEPVAVPPAPAPLWVPADAASEEALGLARAERIDVQRRLALAGFDPRGFDGVFGGRTREAIAAFQAAWGFPATGYLDAASLADLRARTEDAYAALAARAVAEPRAAPKLAPVARERQLAAADGGGGCLRDAQGRIVERQSFTCDLKGLAEKVVSLGRNRLPHEEAGAMPSTDAPIVSAAARADR